MGVTGEVADTSEAAPGLKGSAVEAEMFCARCGRCKSESSECEADRGASPNARRWRKGCRRRYDGRWCGEVEGEDEDEDEEAMSESKGRELIE